MKGIVIQASARSNGHTKTAVDSLASLTGFDILDLKTKNIEQFDYEFRNASDDFLPIMRKLTSEFDLLLFATPVYWYTMSGILKAFFDRITDCLDFEKETGRKLRGMAMGVLSCSQDEEIDYDFELPFRESASYLGMKYLGHVHVAAFDKGISEKSLERLTEYVAQIQKKNKTI